MVKKTIQKKKLTIFYKSSKQKLIEESKQEVLKIFEELKQNTKERQIFDNLLLKLDQKDKDFRLLFIFSLYCSYYHAIKNKINTKNLNFPIEECYKKNNFIILKLDQSHHEILEHLTTYFNTDANNIEPITGKILMDLNALNIDFVEV